MKTAMRLAVYLVMTTASAPAFPEETAAAAGRGEGQVHAAQTSATTDASSTKGDVDTGGGSGEPSIGADARPGDGARDEALAIQEYNRRKFLDQTWMAP